MRNLNISSLKKKLSIIPLFYQLISNRTKIGFKSFSELFAFLIIINPILNKLFCMWFSNLNEKSTFSFNIIKKLINKGIGFGAIRHITPENRSKFNNFIFDHERIDSKNITKEISEIINTLCIDGYSKLPIKLNQNEIIDIQEYFGNCSFYDSQVYAQSNSKEINLDWRKIKNNNSNKRNFCFKQLDTINYLNKHPIINFKYLKQIADLYCGFNTNLYELNTFGTFSGIVNSYVMRKHRDFDDFKFLTFFIALTETTEEDGATLFAPGTHITSKLSKKMIALSAKVGEVYALDTFGFHAGNSNILKPRLTTWIRYGNSTNLATIQNGTSNEIGFLQSN
tara:strand:- start:2742 stop:3755 length:1014 start_codon:yes stop_codon:yes gene_type:complete